MMTDEAYLKQLDDQDIGEGPLIVSGVSAYLDKSAGSDLYKGKLPYKIAADMTRADLRKMLGRPEKSNDEIPLDGWSMDDLKVVVRYTEELKLMIFSLKLPRAE